METLWHLGSHVEFSLTKLCFTEHQGVTPEPSAMTLRTVPDSTPSHHFPTKVSSISNTNENKGVSITGSHEVPGKTSTDGTSTAAGKSASLSLDALAKAKKALQMQRELSEKLKKIPSVSSYVDLNLFLLNL